MYTSSGEAIGLSVNTVPAFLSKLWTLVDDAATDELICWDASGMSFHVLDQARFAKEILPLYFKHNNIASFIRQLNMYGFRKVTSTEATNVKLEKDDMEFAHRYFVKDQEQLLEFIKRKVPTAKTTGVAGSSADEISSKPDEVRHVLLEVNAVKGRQDNLTSKLENLKLENDVLWREVANLRQMHMKQQQVVSKLIQFLVTLVGNKRPLVAGVKRKGPLMLGDSGILLNKITRESSSSSLSEKLYQVHSPQSSPTPKNNQTAGSIVIDDVTDLLSATIAGADVSATAENVDLLSSPTVPLGTIDALDTAKIDDVLEPLAILQDEYPSALELTDVLEDASGEGVVTSLSVDEILSPSGGLLNEGSLSHENTTRTVAVADSIKVPSDFGRHEIANHLDMTATHLAGLRDLLASSPQINIDSNLMLELFNFNMDTLPKCVEDYHCDEEEWRKTIESILPTADQGRLDNSGSIIGNELIQYTPAEDLSTLYDIDEPYHYLVDDESAEFVATSSSTVVPDDFYLSTPQPFTEERLNFKMEDVMEDVD